MAYFEEDVMVPMGKYYWSKKDKVVIKKGTKRTREGATKQIPSLNQVIWKSDTLDIKQGALDIVGAIRAFAGANYDSVSQLSLTLSDKEQELQKSKLDLAAAEARHEQEVKQLQQVHENRTKQWQKKTEHLKH